MSKPPLDLETVVRRNRPTDTAGSIQVDTAADDSRVTLSFGDDREVTYVVLTPTEATTVATALEQAVTETTNTVEKPADE